MRQQDRMQIIVALTFTLSALLSTLILPRTISLSLSGTGNRPSILLAAITALPILATLLLSRSGSSPAFGWAILAFLELYAILVFLSAMGIGIRHDGFVYIAAAALASAVAMGKWKINPRWVDEEGKEGAIRAFSRLSSAIALLSALLAILAFIGLDITILAAAFFVSLFIALAAFMFLTRPRRS